MNQFTEMRTQIIITIQTMFNEYLEDFQGDVACRNSDYKMSWCSKEPWSTEDFAKLQDRISDIAKLEAKYLLKNCPLKEALEEQSPNNEGSDWKVIFHLPYYDLDDEFDSSQDDFSMFKKLFYADTLDKAIKFAQNYIRKQQKSSNGKIWENAEIFSISKVEEDEITNPDPDNLVGLT